MAANVDTLRAVAERSQHDATSSHHVLIPLVAVCLVLQRRQAIFASVGSAWLAGTGLVMTGVLLAVFEAATPFAGNRLTIAVAALVIMWIGGFLTAYGPRAFRAAMFPLFFLVFMIPIPDAITHAATWFLKSGSSYAVAGIFTLTGTPFQRTGFVFSLPQFAIEIADECSGIRSSIGLLLTSLLAGHMFLRHWRTKVGLVALVVPFAVIKNGIRIASLSLLAMHVNRGFLSGRLHHEGGIVFFLLSLAMMAPFLMFLQWSEGRSDLYSRTEVSS